MNAETLKPCPFCGGEAEYERKGDNRQSTIVSCTMCGCVLESGIEWDHWRDWNTRAADNIALQAEVERLRELLGKCVGILDATMEESGRSVEYGEEDPFRMGEWFEEDDMIAIEAARAALNHKETRP